MACPFVGYLPGGRLAPHVLDLVDGQPVVIGDLLIDPVLVPPVQNQLPDDLVLSVCKLNRHGVLKFLIGVDRYTGNLRYGIDMCMGMLELMRPTMRFRHSWLRNIFSKIKIVTIVGGSSKPNATCSRPGEGAMLQLIPPIAI